jgi:hypothetical protein
MLEGKEVPARHPAERELRPHARQPDAPHDIGVGAADEGRRHFELRQGAHHVVRDGAVDLVFDARVDLQAEAAVLFHQPVRHVIVQTLGREIPEQLPRTEMLPRLLGAAPVTAPVASRAGGGYPVDDAEALGRAEQAAAKRPDERRIEQHDAAEELGPAHRGEVAQVTAERMADSIDRRDFLEAFY